MAEAKAAVSKAKALFAARPAEPTPPEQDGAAGEGGGALFPTPNLDAWFRVWIHRLAK